MTPVHVFIRKVETNEVRVYKYHDWYGESFIWTDGNYGCDCNRHEFFECAAGVYEPEVIKCSEGKFRIVKIVDPTNGEIFFSEEVE